MESGLLDTCYGSVIITENDFVLSNPSSIKKSKLLTFKL
ncbi:hypothetical protein OIU84_022378 [Salix udensis]|uniref:Uncharacterized protein n=1 Tax=Salix udensis TaxID=889485 RepID=A0AAD6PEP1_9ROSI|nr:hypothetical protein OIU84_022378 [Salix udensis]